MAVSLSSLNPGGAPSLQVMFDEWWQAGYDEGALTPEQAARMDNI
jgi:hypothetical protein